jgi:hypothetical protein
LTEIVGEAHGPHGPGRPERGPTAAFESGQGFNPDISERLTPRIENGHDSDATTGQPKVDAIDHLPCRDVNWIGQTANRTRIV